MRKFDYSFLINGQMPARFANIVQAIGALRERSNIRKGDYLPVYSELEKIAKVQSVKSSNAIEGIEV